MTTVVPVFIYVLLSNRDDYLCSHNWNYYYYYNYITVFPSVKNYGLLCINDT